MIVVITMTSQALYTGNIFTAVQRLFQVTVESPVDRHCLDPAMPSSNRQGLLTKAMVSHATCR